jgi:hypothetical protein
MDGRRIIRPMDSKTLVTGILSGGATGAIVSAIWNLSIKVWLQGREERAKERLAGTEAKWNETLAKLEADLDRAQRLGQASIDRSVFVTRAHFETEFEAMKQVFSHLSQLQIGFNGLRPILAVESSDENHEQKVGNLLARLGKVSSSYNALLVESEGKAPFYPAELYAAIEECERAASLEINAIRTSGENMFEPEWYEQGERNRGRFSKSYYKAAEIIRDRISRLAILPSL